MKEAYVRPSLLQPLAEAPQKTSGTFCKQGVDLCRGGRLYLCHHLPQGLLALLVGSLNAAASCILYLSIVFLTESIN
jgi:hypothetical protein